jgi:hypothetical protein
MGSGGIVFFEKSGLFRDGEGGCLILGFLGREVARRLGDALGEGEFPVGDNAFADALEVEFEPESG